MRGVTAAVSLSSHTHAQASYLLHIRLSHVNVGVHLVEVMLSPIRFFTVPLESSLTLKETQRNLPQIEVNLDNMHILFYLEELSVGAEFFKSIRSIIILLYNTAVT